MDRFRQTHAQTKTVVVARCFTLPTPQNPVIRGSLEISGTNCSGGGFEAADIGLFRFWSGYHAETDGSDL